MLQDMDQNSSFPYTINREAIQTQANAHHHKSFSSQPVTLKTT